MRSSTVTNALDLKYGRFVNAMVKFVRLMNKWFDVVNVKHIREGQNSRNPDLMPFTDINDLRITWLETKFLRHFNDWNVAVEKKYRSLIKTTNALKPSNYIACGKAIHQVGRFNKVSVQIGIIRKCVGR